MSDKKELELIEELLQGKRRIPMNDEFMKNKSVDAEFYGKLQLSSYRKRNQKERYIDNLDVSQWVKDYGLSRKTFYQKMKILSQHGVVKTIEKDGKKIYKLPITKGHYTLIEYDTLSFLTSGLNSDAIKVYMVCKVYCENYGKLAFTREQFLEKLGYSPTKTLLARLDNIMKLLIKSELIQVEKIEETIVNKKKKTNRYFVTNIKR